MMISKLCASAYYLFLLFSCKFRMGGLVLVGAFFPRPVRFPPVAEKREAEKISYFAE